MRLPYNWSLITGHFSSVGTLNLICAQLLGGVFELRIKN